MYEIVEKGGLCENIFLLKVRAPRVASKAKPGNFIVLKVDGKGERIPLTIADWDEDAITVVFQRMGKTTDKLSTLEGGDRVHTFLGPLGNAFPIKNYGTVVMVGGGCGIAPVFPIARALKEAGNRMISILGARSRDLLFWEDRMQSVSDELIVCTDDGSYGRKDLVTAPLKERMSEADLAIVIGPPVMMKFCAKTTENTVKTIASLNPIMVDGIGMCGSCRVSIGGETKFACVDGPAFDAHMVDWDGFMNRNTMYEEEEAHSRGAGCVA